MLKKVSFAVTILGIGILLGMLVLPAREMEDLQSARDNEKVFLEGKVEGEKDFGDFRILKIKGIDIYCSCSESYLGKDVYVEGFVEEFNGKRQIRVLRIVEILH
jgi:hypothetical protein